MKTVLEDVPTIPHLVAYACRRFGERIAIEDGAAILTFSDLEGAVTEAARAIVAAGIRHGDRVAIWAPNSACWIVAALGLQTAGAVLVPLNTRLKGSEAGFILRKSGARILITVTDFLSIDYPALLRNESLPQLERVILLSGSGSATSWQSFLASGNSVGIDSVRQRLCALRGDDTSDILFTSGTTGSPKGVMSSHQQTLRTYIAYSAILGLKEDDRYLIVNPFFHTFGYKAGWLSALMRGATVLPHAVFDPAQILRRIERERISVLPGPPTLYQSILASPNLRDFDLSSLRFAITGAASIPVTLIERMKSELGFKTVLTGYGMTETCGVVSLCCESDDAQTIATTSGKAVEGMEVRIVDEHGEDVETGAPGEILARGYSIMQGYFEDPEGTSEAIDSQGWLHTGDVGTLDQRGYIRITDRKKDMFIVGGFNCYPAEIENILLSHPAIQQVAVVGVPDERMGEVAKAFVVAKAGTTVTSDEIISWSREHMANFKVPRAVEICQQLPMNASGKVQKYLLNRVNNPS